MMTFLAFEKAAADNPVQLQENRRQLSGAI
jgi:hypothetical protein